MKIVI